MSQKQEWYLRSVCDADLDGLHALCCIPEIYRYLADGIPPPRSIVEGWIRQSQLSFASHNVGVWILESGKAPMAGCVLLEIQPQSRSSELTYLLHPKYWGQGLATRMSWTVMRHAFEDGGIEEIVAGADKPNTASVAVMKRLGMSFLKEVEYPLGAGVEYVFKHNHAAPFPLPKPIPFR